jgi:hypothetical protein
LIAPIPVEPKFAPSPLALFHALPDQFTSVVFQAEVAAPLSHVTSPARTGATFVTRLKSAREKTNPNGARKEIEGDREVAVCGFMAWFWLRLGF